MKWLGIYFYAEYTPIEVSEFTRLFIKWDWKARSS